MKKLFFLATFVVATGLSAYAYDSCLCPKKAPVVKNIKPRSIPYVASQKGIIENSNNVTITVDDYSGEPILVPGVVKNGYPIIPINLREVRNSFNTNIVVRRHQPQKSSGGMENAAPKRNNSTSIGDGNVDFPWIQFLLFLILVVLFLILTKLFGKKKDESLPDRKSETVSISGPNDSEIEKALSKAESAGGTFTRYNNGGYRVDFQKKPGTEKPDLKEKDSK